MDTKATEETESAMRQLLARGLKRDDVNPLTEAVGGAYEQAIEFTRLEREKYVGEVGKRDGNYIYHFWLRDVADRPNFGDKLADAFLEVFKRPENLSAKHDEIMRCLSVKQIEDQEVPCGYWGQPSDFENGHCPECGSTSLAITLSSWGVKVTGYADNPLADDLAAKVFDVFDRLIATPSS